MADVMAASGSMMPSLTFEPASVSILSRLTAATAPASEGTASRRSSISASEPELQPVKMPAVAMARSKMLRYLQNIVL